ncbi:hypothetical protein ACFQY7_17150 [Actinomadura luteofluorescens]|uniref:hypothetical protein n=1 Tax=Actinomadura luteofluorescens TaxID=46163 RepID=UPI003642CFED
MKAHAVVFGSTGNQDYIFGSNKRRENVGASYLITCVEDVWLRRALKHHPDDMRTLRLDEHGMQVVTASAGGAVLLVREAAEGRRIVGAVTGSALREAPGLDVCGAVGEEFEFGAAETLARAVEAARDSLRTARLARRSPRLRFPGLPIADRCRSSGLPAHRVVKFGGKRPPNRDQRRAWRSWTPSTPRCCGSQARWGCATTWTRKRSAADSPTSSTT